MLDRPHGSAEKRLHLHEAQQGVQADGLAALRVSRPRLSLGVGHRGNAFFNCRIFEWKDQA